MNSLKKKIADSYLKYAKKTADLYMEYVKRSYDSRSVYDRIASFWHESPITYKVAIIFRLIAVVGCVWGSSRVSSTIGQFLLYFILFVALAGVAIFCLESLVIKFAFGSLKAGYSSFAAMCGVKTYETPQPEEEYIFAEVKNGETETGSSDSDPIESEAKKDAGTECEPDE